MNQTLVNQIPYSSLLTLEEGSRPFSDIVHLIESSASSDAPLFASQLKGRVHSTLNGKGLHCTPADRIAKGSIEHLLLDEQILLSIHNIKTTTPITAYYRDDNYLSLTVIANAVETLAQLQPETERPASDTVVIAAAKQGFKETIQYPRGSQVHAITIFLPRSAISSLLGVDLSVLKDEIDREIATLEHQHVSYAMFRASLATVQCASEILNAQYKDRLLYDFYQAKAKELICHIIGSFIDFKDKDEIPYRYSPNDLEAIELAKKIALSDIKQPPTISSLALQVGLSENKLTYGFNYFFGESAHSMVVGQRMDKAMKLLTQTNDPIQEIAQQVGYKGTSGFIKAFKRKFGITPAKQEAFSHPQKSL